MAAKARARSETLNQRLHQMQSAQKESTKLLSKINAQHDKVLQRAGGAQVNLSTKASEKLAGLYSQAVQAATVEMQIAGMTTQAIVELVAGMKKRKEVGTGGSRGRKRRMAKILHPVPTGKMVAAGQPGVGPNGTTQWVLANVLSFNEDADTYKMQDAEDAANVFEVGMDALLPLLQEHEKDPSLFFAKDERVLALYPQTTTFYPALVIASAKRRKQNDYVLTFDEEVEKRIVEWMYVLPLQRGMS